jgi:hypothetical protein
LQASLLEIFIEIEISTPVLGGERGDLGVQSVFSPQSQARAESFPGDSGCRLSRDLRFLAELIMQVRREREMKIDVGTAGHGTPPAMIICHDGFDPRSPVDNPSVPAMLGWNSYRIGAVFNSRKTKGPKA